MKKITLFLLSLLILFALVPADPVAAADTCGKVDATASDATTLRTYYVNIPYSEWSKYFWTDEYFGRLLDAGLFPLDPFSGLPDRDYATRLQDNQDDFPGNAVIDSNQGRTAEGHTTYMVLFKTTCTHCLNLLRTLGADPAYNNFSYILVDGLYGESPSTIKNTLNNNKINFNDQVVYYNGTDTFSNGLDLLLNLTDYGKTYTDQNTPYIFVFRGNGTTADLRAIINGPNANVNTKELINIADSLDKEDPNNPLDDDNAPAPPTPGGDMEKQIVGSGAYDTTFTADAYYSEAFKILEEVNKKRLAADPTATPFTMDKDLMTAAMQRAAEIAFYYRAEDLPTGGRSHLRPNGDNGPKAITGTTKYSSPVGGRLVVTENIAEGYPDAQATLNAWLGSTHGHCAAIMDSISQAKSGCADGENNYGIQSVGVGYVVTEDGEIHSTILFSNQPAVEIQKGAIADTTGKNWDIKVSDATTNNMTVKPVSSYTRQADTSFPTLTTPVTFNSAADAAKTISFSSDYKYDPAKTLINHSVFQPTYVNVTGGTAVKAEVQNGKVVLTPQSAGTVTVQVGLAASSTGGQPKVMNTFEVVVGGATPTEYQVTLNHNQGTRNGQSTETVSTTNGGQINLSNYVPTRSGWTLTGWNSSTGQTGVNGLQTVTANGVTYTAQWRQNEYQVTLNYNQGTLGGQSSQVVNTTNGGQINLSNYAPTRSGWTLTGWNSSTGQTGVNGLQTVTANGVTYTAQWRQNEYQVTLNYNQGTLGGQSSQVVSTTNGGQINLSNYAPTRSGWTLTGWNSSTGQTGVNGLQTVTSNVTYTAQWQENPKPEYNITLDLDGGSLTHALTFKTTNQTVNFSQVGTPTKVGFDFIGWQDLTNGGTVGKNMSKQVDKDTNFKALWNPQTFTVTFDMRGHGTAQQPPSQTVTYGGKVTQPAPDPTETGWDFGGWTTAGGTHWNFTTDTVTSNLVLYAKWDEQRVDGEHTVTLYLNGGDLGGVSGLIEKTTTGQKFDFGGLGTPTRYGYSFNQWADNQTGQPVSGIVDLTANAEYRADWTPTVHTVTFENEHGTTSTQNFNFGAMIPEPTQPSAAGYTFEGWYNRKDNTLYDFSQPVMADENLTLYAKWTALPPAEHTVTLNGNGGTINGSPTYTTQTVNQQIDLGAQPQPQMTGFVFNGWTNAAGQPVSGVQTLSADAVYDASWAAVPTTEYTVTLNGNGGTINGSPTYTTQTLNQQIDLGAQPQPQMTGFVFNGWTDAAGQPVSGVQTLSADAVYNASWAAVPAGEYTVTLNGNGGTINGSPTYTTQTLNQQIDLGAQPQPQMTGFIFNGWTDAAGQPVSGVQTLSADAVYDASWAAVPAVEYNVTLNGNGGTINGSPTYTTQTVNQQIDLNTQPQPQMTGFIFNGWTDAAGQPVSGVQTLSADAVYDAAWTAVPAGEYTVTLNLNGGTINGQSQITVSTVNGKIDLRKYIPSKVGNTFESWLDAAGNRVLGEVTLTVDSAFTAVWRVNPVRPYIDLYSLWRGGDCDFRLPATGFSAFRPTALSLQPGNLKYIYKGMQLQIPSLDVLADIVEVPAADGSWSVEWLGTDIGLLEGSAMPGEGRAFIAAHNHLSTMEVGPFARLPFMTVGSRAFISNDQGEFLPFEVYANEKIGADEVDTMFEIASLEENSLTFISCEDEMIEGGYANRRIVCLRPLAKLSAD